MAVSCPIPNNSDPTTLVPTTYSRLCRNRRVRTGHAASGQGECGSDSYQSYRVDEPGRTGVCRYGDASVDRMRPFVRASFCLLRSPSETIYRLPGPIVRLPRIIPPHTIWERCHAGVTWKRSI